VAGGPDGGVCLPQTVRPSRPGRSGVNVSVASFDGIDEGREAIASFIRSAEPVMDGVRPMYYPELQEIFGRMQFGLRHYWSGRFLRELPDEAIEMTAAQFAQPEVEGGVLFEPLHGAAARVSADATAFTGREARYNATFTSEWTDPTKEEPHVGWA